MSLRQTKGRDSTQVKDGDNANRLPSELLGISVVIPTLNESGNIADLLVRLDQAMTQAGIFYEAIVVDDHSTDNTCEVAATIAQNKNLPVHVLTKQGQPGKAFSLMEGFATACYDVFAMIDGDLQYPPEAIPQMLRKLEHADIVVGDRRVSYSGVDRFRGVLSGIFTTVTGLLFGLDTDVQSGLKVFRRKVYDGTEMQPGEWSLDLYLIMHAIHKGYSVTNMPIVYAQRLAGESKVMPFKVAIELLMTVLVIKLTSVTHSLLGGTRTSKRQLRGQQYSVASDAPLAEQVKHYMRWLDAGDLRITCFT